jgi:hypothetical protein
VGPWHLLRKRRRRRLLLRGATTRENRFIETGPFAGKAICSGALAISTSSSEMPVVGRAVARILPFSFWRCGGLRMSLEIVRQGYRPCFFTSDVRPTMSSAVARAIVISSLRRAPARARTATLCKTLVATRAKTFTSPPVQRRSGCGNVSTSTPSSVNLLRPHFHAPAKGLSPPLPWHP